MNNTMSALTSRSDLGPLPEDDLDGLLREFYRAEMPQPWPKFRAPAPRVRLAPAVPQASGYSARLRSLLALAASVAVIALGAWWLSASADTPPVANAPHLTNGANPTADRPKFDKQPADGLPFDIRVDPNSGSSIELKLPVEDRPNR